MSLSSDGYWSDFKWLVLFKNSSLSLYPSLSSSRSELSPILSLSLSAHSSIFKGYLSWESDPPSPSVSKSHLSVIVSWSLLIPSPSKSVSAITGETPSWKSGLPESLHQKLILPSPFRSCHTSSGYWSPSKLLIAYLFNGALSQKSSWPSPSVSHQVGSVPATFSSSFVNWSQSQLLSALSPILSRSKSNHSFSSRGNWSLPSQ